MSTVFQLFTITKHNPEAIAIVITPEPTKPEKVQAAWTYAVRMNPKQLHVPDYDAALKMMSERHLSWQIFQGKVANIHYDRRNINRTKDEPET